MERGDTLLDIHGNRYNLAIDFPVKAITMNLIQKLILKWKLRKIEREVRRVREKYAELYNILERLRRELIDYSNLLYKFGLIDVEMLRKRANREAREILRKLREEERERLDYIG